MCTPLAAVLRSSRRIADTYVASSYWVTEKSDGIRVLLFVHTSLQTKEQNIYLVSNPFARRFHI